jgi:hypothetical protein
MSLRNVPNDYAYKNSWMMKNVVSVKILNLGSSHAYYGIQPSKFSKSAFNLAFPSQSLKYDCFLLQKYIQICDSLEYVIVPISYFSLRQQCDMGDESWRIRGYCIYMGCDYYTFSPMFNLEITSKNKIKYLKGAILHQVNFMTCDSLGWGTTNSYNYRTDDWKKTGIIASKRHTKSTKDYVNENLLYIENMIKQVQKRGIKIILLTTPTYSTYYNNLDTEQLREMEDICNQIDRDDENVIYLNWLKHNDFTEDDFFDADHLNEYGAEKLTQMIDEYIFKMEKEKLQ